MIGFYDYTVVLTYLSLVSAICGMGFSITGHPIIATICLLLCASTKIFSTGTFTRKDQTPNGSRTSHISTRVKVFSICP